MEHRQSCTKQRRMSTRNAQKTGLVSFSYYNVAEWLDLDGVEEASVEAGLAFTGVSLSLVAPTPATLPPA